MQQEQHYLPQVYLRQWCLEGRLWRYRRMGPQQRLVPDRKTPRTIAFEPDLYTIPVGGMANGLTGQGVEALLAQTIDSRFGAIAARTSTLDGKVVDPRDEADLVWLLQTFVARGRGTLRRVEAGMGEVIEGYRPMIESMMQRANQQKSRDELRSYLDYRMPRVAALAGLAAILGKHVPADLRWLDGDIHIIQSTHFQELLRAIGAGEFVTFEAPVVEWESNPVGLRASFSMSPERLLVVFERGCQPAEAEYWDAVFRHHIATIKHREGLICRSQVFGVLLSAAAELRPSGLASP